MSKRITVKLHAVCQRPDCERVMEVRSRWAQKVRKYCCLSCAAIMRNRDPKARIASGLGAKLRSAKERARLLEVVKDMSPLDAFRKGYMRGLYSKHRQVRTWRRKKAA